MVFSLSGFNRVYLHIFLNPIVPTVLRPRIRTNGFYCLRTLYSRAPSNDSFWEEKITQSVEVRVVHKALEKKTGLENLAIIMLRMSNAVPISLYHHERIFLPLFLSLFFQVKFYRHMRFFDDGRMLYSLDTVEPDDMAKHLTLGAVVPKKIFEGKYTLVGKTVHVEVREFSSFHKI